VSYEDDMLDLFLTPGWKHVTEKAQEQREGLENIRGVSTVEELYLRKGQVLVLDYLLGLEAYVKNLREDTHVDIE